jgi:energy-coupling factor transport system substrate-specific component
MAGSLTQRSGDRTIGITGFTTLDLVMIAVLGVVFGLLNTPFGVVFQFLQTTFGPAGQALFAPWAISMVMSALIVRKPGAALLNGLINGLFQLLSGNPAGVVNLAWGFALGSGVEVGLALYLYLFGYRRLSWPAAMLGGGIACAFSYTVSAIVYSYLSAGTTLLVLSWIGQGVAGAVESGLVAFILAEGLRRSGLLRSYAAEVPSGAASA